MGFQIALLSGIVTVLVFIFSAILKVLNVLERIERLKEIEEREIVKIRIKSAQNESKNKIYSDNGEN